MVLSLYYRPVKERGTGGKGVCVCVCVEGGGGNGVTGGAGGIGVPQCEWCAMFVFRTLGDNLRFGYSHRPTKQELNSNKTTTKLSP